MSLHLSRIDKYQRTGTLHRVPVVLNGNEYLGLFNILQSGKKDGNVEH